MRKSTLGVLRQLLPPLAEGRHDLPTGGVADAGNLRGVLGRLPPLGAGHINLLDHHALAVPEAVRRGELRPLRDRMSGVDEVG